MNHVEITVVLEDYFSSKDKMMTTSVRTKDKQFKLQRMMHEEVFVNESYFDCVFKEMALELKKAMKK
jgi:hypothetical protein